MIFPDVKIEKIDDFFIMDAVDEVADCSTEDEYQTVVNSRFFHRSLMKDHQNGNDRDCRYTDKYQGFVFHFQAGKQAKRHSRIADMRETEEIFYDDHGFIQANMVDHHHLGILIQNDQGIGNKK